MKYVFSSAPEVISVYGQPLLALRKTWVSIREAKGVEVMRREYGDLEAIEGVDYIVEPLDGSPPYPCKKDIFHETWELIGQGKYRKKALSRLVQVPKEDQVTLGTLEGRITVKYPDYIVLGAKDEVYSNSYEFVANDMEFVEE